MWDNVIGWHIRRTNRNLLLTNLGLLAVLAIVTLLNGRYLVNFLLGPFPADEGTLASLKAGQEPFEYFLSVKGQSAPEAFFKESKQTLDKYTHKVRSEEHVADFTLVLVGQRLLVVKVPGRLDPTQKEFTGSLAPLPPQIRNSISQEAFKKRAELDEVLYPEMLDATGFRGPGCWGLAIGLPLYGLAWWNIVRAFRRIARTERHPIVHWLTRYGTPSEVAKGIDAQMADRGNVVSQSGLTLMPTWCLRPTTYGLQIIHVFDLVWIYKKVTKHSVNFIPTGTTSAAVICTRYGQVLEVNSGNLTESLLQQMFERAPWVVTGYSAELAGIWKKDAGGLVAAVDGRREQTLGSINQQQGPAGG
jgi:hypothetical protein